MPLKLVTDGSEEWANWKSKYKYEGKTIPILFVIRADGEQLYGQSGSLRGDALPQMLADTLGQAGRSINEQEYEFLASRIQATESALGKTDQADAFLTAARELSPLAKNGGTLGSLGSFAEPAIKADELAGEIAKLAGERIRQLATILDDPSADAVQNLAMLYEIELTMNGWLPIKSQLADLMPGLVRQESLRQLHQPAKLIARARSLAVSDKLRDRKQAGRMYADLQLKFANHDNDDIVATIQADLDRWQEAGVFTEKDVQVTGDDTSKPAARAESYRRWSDTTGTFTIRAKLIGLDDREVTLRKPDGSTLQVPLEKLSEADRKYLSDRD